MKNNSKRNISKSLKNRATDVLISGRRMHIDEQMSSGKLRDIIRYAEEEGDLSAVERLKTYLEWILDKESKIVVENSIVELGDFTIEHKIEGKRGKVITKEFNFSIVEHFPTETYMLVYLHPDGKLLAACILDRNKHIRPLPKTEEKISNDLVEHFNRQRLMSDLRGHFNKMMSIIQPDTRRFNDSKPYPGNRENARKVAAKIKEATGIDFKWRTFMKTRGSITKQPPRTIDYLYVGGFDISDLVTVRITRFVGMNMAEYNIYHIYIRYGSYAFMLRLKYMHKDIVVGIGNGTAWRALLEDGYLSNTNIPISNITSTSNILNVYPFMKRLHDDESKQLILPNGTETNVCDLIFSLITQIITEKQLIKQTSITQGTQKKLSLGMLKKDYIAHKNEKDLKEKNNKGQEVHIKDVRLDTDEDNSTADESSDDDFEM